MRRLCGRVPGFVVGRRGTWVMLAAGIALAAVTGPLAGKLGALEDNNPASFLPASSPSAAVLRYQQAHAGGSIEPAVIVYERDRGLTAADLATVRRARIAAARLAHAGPASPVVVSPDRDAAFFTVPLTASTAGRRLGNQVKALRARLARTAVPATAPGGPGTLRYAVGGPAGTAADAANAFAGIDGRLLLLTVLVVAALLLLTYRSPLLWLLPLLSVALAAGWSQGAAYGLARAGLTVNGMTVGILSVLVFGAGTDYALLLTARYREELCRHEDHHLAMAAALRRAGPAIVTSGITVVLALLCLLSARLSDVAALGPVCAAGVVCAMAAQLLVLPALLVICGRRVFWPFVPRPGHGSPELSGWWAAAAQVITRRPALLGAGLAVLLAAGAGGLAAYHGGVGQANGFRDPVQSVAAQQILARHIGPGAGAPATVLVRPGAAAAARAAALASPGVASVGPASTLGTRRTFTVTFAAGPDSTAAQHDLVVLRDRLRTASGPGALVGGQTATDVDTAAAAAHDRLVVFPLVLLVVLVMLGLLLRAAVAPVLLTASVALSYLCSLGVSILVFRYLFRFPGVDPSVPIFGFVFLVALGVDYNIFLVARAREEVAGHGPAGGMARALAVTGGVITSAGVVLAATFAVLAVLPLVALTEVGFLVAFGVLADTVLVRSALVPAVAVLLGWRWWWPGARPGAAVPAAGAAGSHPGDADGPGDAGRGTLSRPAR
jgi:RND superfamily putative drug exporter